MGYSLEEWSELASRPTAEQPTLPPVALPPPIPQTAKIIEFLGSGRWNYDRHGQLRKSARLAIKTAKAAVPILSDLAERIIPLFPGRPTVSDNIKCFARDPSCWSELLMYAVDRPWISLNSERMTNVIVIDCDHDDLDLVDDIVRLGCPAPLVVTDPATGRFHASWFLADPVAVGLADAIGPRKALAYARGLLTAALRADRLFNGKLTRNPFALRSALAGPLRRKPEALYDQTVVAAWDAHPVLWRVDRQPGPSCRLADIIGVLSEHYQPAWPQRTSAVKTVERSEGRNCTLFQTIADWARQNYSAYDCDRVELTAVAEQINGTFPVPLGEKEVAGIVRSVHKWMRTKWRGRGDNTDRGVMTRLGIVKDDMILQERQELSGPWARNKTASNIDQRLADAVARLRVERPDAKFTQTELATASGASLKTIKRRWAQILADAPPAPVPVPSTEPVRGSHGVHQGLPRAGGYLGVGGGRQEKVVREAPAAIVPARQTAPFPVLSIRAVVAEAPAVITHIVTPARAAVPFPFPVLSVAGARPAPVPVPSTEPVRGSNGVHQGLPRAGGRLLGVGVSALVAVPSVLATSADVETAGVEPAPDASSVVVVTVPSVLAAKVQHGVGMDLAGESQPTVATTAECRHVLLNQRLHLEAGRKRAGSLSEIERLVSAGADVQARYHRGITPLHLASCRGHVDVAEFLADNGADMNARNKDGDTPLHWAARYGHAEVLKLMISKEGDVNTRNKDGDTPLHLAVDYEHPLEGEVQHVNDEAKLLPHIKQERRHEAVLHVILSNGADVNAINSNSDTALHLAASAGRFELVKFLLLEDADVNARNKDGDTPLHWAARNGHGVVAEFLISEGADVNAVNDVGVTPLQLAAANESCLVRCERAAPIDERDRRRQRRRYAKQRRTVLPQAVGCQTEAVVAPLKAASHFIAAVKKPRDVDAIVAPAPVTDGPLVLKKFNPDTDPGEWVYTRTLWEKNDDGTFKTMDGSWKLEYRPLRPYEPETIIVKRPGKRDIVIEPELDVPCDDWLPPPSMFGRDQTWLSPVSFGPYEVPDDEPEPIQVEPEPVERFDPEENNRRVAERLAREDAGRIAKLDAAKARARAKATVKAA